MGIAIHLKRCACGQAPELKTARAAEDAMDCWVECGGCGAKTERIEDAYADYDGAADLWNRGERVNPPRVIRDRMAGAYKLHDRRQDGHRGRWRYAVFALIREGGEKRDELMAYFTSRGSAAGFTSKCAVFGEAFAYRIHARQMAPRSPIHGALKPDDKPDDQAA